MKGNTMHVRNLIEASANVVTITTLKRGDGYKRIIPATQFGEAKLQFGVVTSVMNNGSEGAISAVEYAHDFSGVVVSVKAFDATADVALFAATVDEVMEHIAEIRQAVDHKVTETAQKAAEARDMAARTAQVLDGLIELSEPQTSADAPV